MAFVSFPPATCWRDMLTIIFFFQKIKFSEMLCCVVARVIPDASKDRSYFETFGNIEYNFPEDSNPQKQRCQNLRYHETAFVSKSPFTSTLPFDSVQVQVTCRSKKIKLSAVRSTTFTNPVVFLFTRQCGLISFKLALDRILGRKFHNFKYELSNYTI